MELVEHVFSKFLLKGVVRDDILDLMEQFGLIAKFSPVKTDEKYFVPSQLKVPPDSLCAMCPRTLTPVRYMSSLLLVLCPMACSHGLFLDLFVGVLRLVQLNPLLCTEMEHGSSLGNELSMI